MNYRKKAVPLLDTAFNPKTKHYSIANYFAIDTFKNHIPPAQWA